MPVLLTYLLLLFITAPLLWLFRPHRTSLAGWLAALPPAAITIWLLSQIPAVGHGEFVTEYYDWAAELGLVISFRLDGLSLFFSLIITGIGTAIALYTATYLEDDPSQGYFYCLLFLFMGSMLGLVWANNLLALFVFWEGTSITSYLLIAYKYKSKEAKEGARRAFIVTGLGGLAMLAGFILLGQAANTYTISALTHIPNLTDYAIYPAALMLILVGAFTKSAQFPFHFWLPGAMSAPTPASAYLHSATMVKAGIYLLARLHPALHDSELWFWTLFIVGGVTMLLGAISALRYYDLKAMLAYATISQLGILVMLLAFDSDAMVAAVVVGILAHALYKGPLFMMAGIIDHATGTRDIRRLAGLWRQMPWVAVVALLATFSMAGLPPLFGFLSKELLLENFYHELDHNPLMAWSGLMAVAITGAFFVAYSLTIVWDTFFRAESEIKDPAPIHHAPTFHFVLPPLILVLLGTIAPFTLGWIEYPFLSAAAASISNSEIHLHLALWHGVTLPLIISLIAIFSGILLFMVRDQLRTFLQAMPTSLNGVAIFNRINDGLYAFASWTTRIVQGGTIASQASVILLAAVGAFVIALFHLDWANDLNLDITQRPKLSEIMITLLAIIAAIETVRLRSRIGAIISLGVVGVTVTLFFIFFSAPDLALTQLLIDVLTLVLLVLVFHRVGSDNLPPMSLSRKLRNGIISMAVGVFGFSLVILSAGVQVDTSISDFFRQLSVPDGKGANMVNAILVDFRGFDTMGEIAVLGIAAIGGYALLQAPRLRAFRDRLAAAQRRSEKE